MNKQLAIAKLDEIAEDSSCVVNEEYPELSTELSRASQVLEVCMEHGFNPEVTTLLIKAATLDDYHEIIIDIITEAF